MCFALGFHESKRMLLNKRHTKDGCCCQVKRNCRTALATDCIPREFGGRRRGQELNAYGNAAAMKWRVEGAYSAVACCHHQFFVVVQEGGARKIPLGMESDFKPGSSSI